MSEKALRDHNTIPGLERKNASSIKGTLNKSYVGNADENVEEWQRNNSSSVSPPTNGDSIITTAVEIGNSEVEYIESQNLNDVEDVQSSVKTLLDVLESKDWVLVCEALNNIRRLSIYHKETMKDMLVDVISLVVKSLKNPRSAVCKTAIMTSEDIFCTYNDQMIDSLDPMLLQLLLKSSQDKRFVCEAAEKALVAMTTWISPALLLPKLEPYLKHRNPRIRAKASMCFSRSVPHLGVEGIRTFGTDKLIQTAASQLSDQLPESREAARILILELQTLYEKFNELSLNESENNAENNSWEDLCQSKLSPLNAQAVLRVTSVARDSLLLSS